MAPTPITQSQRALMARYLRRRGVTPHPVTFIDVMIRLYESIYPPQPGAPGATEKES